MANIGSLFVKLGLQGADKTIGSLNAVQKGLKGISETSLATKAAVVGAVYALQRLFDASGKRGADLQRYSNELSLSTQVLQRYQKAAMGVNVSNEEVSQSFQSISESLTEMLNNTGKAPAGLEALSVWAGGWNDQKINEFRQSPETMLQEIQKIMQTRKDLDPQTVNNALKTFLPSGMVGALRANAFTPEKLANQDIYSEGEIKRLAGINASWNKFFDKIEMAIGRLNSKFGDKFINGLTKVADASIKMLESMVIFADKTDLFTKVGDALAYVAKKIEELGTYLNKIEGIKDKNLFTLLDATLPKPKKDQAGPPKPRGALDKTKDFIFKGPYGEDTQASFISALISFVTKLNEITGGGMNGTLPYGNGVAPGPYAPGQAPVQQAPKSITPSGAIAPNAPAQSVGATNQKELNFNQTLNFNNDGSNAQEVADVSVRATRNAFRELSTQMV